MPSRRTSESKVVLRYSKPIPLLEDSAEQQDKTFQYITRWIMTDATADTHSYDAIAAAMPPQSDH